MIKPARVIIVVLSVVSIAPTCLAQVIEFDEDRVRWVEAVGDFATVHFADLDRLQFLDDQYAECGVVFSDGDDFAGPGGCEFATDLAGAIGTGPIHLAFNSPMSWIACDFPGVLQIELVHDEEVVFKSSQFGSSGVRHFAGMISTDDFDAAVITGLLGDVGVDNLHFGPAAPTDLPDIEDCNGNGFVDFCDQFEGSFDCNDNDVPDECEVPPRCLGDADGNCAVDRDDLMTVLSEWGQNESDADVNGSGLVDVEDLIAVVLGWGTC